MLLCFKAVGRAVDMPGWSFNALIEGISVFVICSILTILLSPPVALLAIAGRGYISPLEFVVFTIVLAQIAAAAGYGHLFPWSVPAIASGITGDDNVVINGASILIVLLTSIAGITGTAF